jgi:hypothetical protein
MRYLVLIALALSACTKHSKEIDSGEAKKLLIDRNWIDRMPETERDKLHVYRFVPNMGGGVFQDRTLYKGTFELFSFSVDGDHILFDLHETSEHVNSQFHIENVDGPKPFDLKLTIWSDPRGPTIYYGMRSETASFQKLLGQQ